MIDTLTNRSVAVTGASGYIGSALAVALAKQGAKVLRVSRTALSPQSGIEDLQGDVCDAQCWPEILDRAQVVFHLAGGTSVYAAADNPEQSLRSTLQPIKSLVAAAQGCNAVPRVVYASTATVYGLTDDLPVSETRDCNPVTVYDQHKVMAERQLALASEQGILNSVSLRLANVYGPSAAQDRGVLNKITAMALQGQDLQVYGDGHPIRDYVYIDDVVQAFMCAGGSNGLKGRAFNVASGQGVSLKDAFEMVAAQAFERTGKKIGISYVPWPASADAIEHRNFIATIQAMQDAFNWQPATSLHAGIGRMMDKFRGSMIHG